MTSLAAHINISYHARMTGDVCSISLCHGCGSAMAVPHRHPLDPSPNPNPKFTLSEREVDCNPYPDPGLLLG